MMLTQAVREANTEHDIFFLLEAYVEALGNDPKSFPGHLTGLPLTSIDHVKDRMQGLLDELCRGCRAPVERTRAEIQEALDVFGEALVRLNWLKILRGCEPPALFARAELGECAAATRNRECAAQAQRSHGVPTYSLVNYQVLWFICPAVVQATGEISQRSDLDRISSAKCRPGLKCADARCNPRFRGESGSWNSRTGQRANMPVRTLKAVWHKACIRADGGFVAGALG